MPPLRRVPQVRGPHGQVFVRGVEIRGPHGQVFVRGVEIRGPHGQVFVRGVEISILGIWEAAECSRTRLQTTVASSP
jgi:hypothetical protein